MNLQHYTVGDYTPGAPLWKQILWYSIGDRIVRSRTIAPSWIKVFTLRCFGAQIGTGVRIKPGVQIKFPWRLAIGDSVWIGEHAWIDNVAMVTIGSHTCLSQGVYLCTGNHDWSDCHFQLIPRPIQIGTGCWIAARATIGPGVCVGDGAVLGLGSVAHRSLQPMMIYVGNPAAAIKSRIYANSNEVIQSAPSSP